MSTNIDLTGLAEDDVDMLIDGLDPMTADARELARLAQKASPSMRRMVLDHLAGRVVERLRLRREGVIA